MEQCWKSSLAWTSHHEYVVCSACLCRKTTFMTRKVERRSRRLDNPTYIYTLVMEGCRRKKWSCIFKLERKKQAQKLEYKNKSTKFNRRKPTLNLWSERNQGEKNLKNIFCLAWSCKPNSLTVYCVIVTTWDLGFDIYISLQNCEIFLEGMHYFMAPLFKTGNLFLEMARNCCQKILRGENVLNYVTYEYLIMNT